MGFLKVHFKRFCSVPFFSLFSLTDLNFYNVNFFISKVGFYLAIIIILVSFSRAFEKDSSSVFVECCWFVVVLIAYCVSVIFALFHRICEFILLISKQNSLFKK